MGIEVAQFIFIGILVMLAWVMKDLLKFDLYKRTNFIAYTTGGIGMYWLIDRLSGII